MLVILIAVAARKTINRYFPDATWTAKPVHWTSKFPSLAHINPADAADYSNVVM